MTASTVAALLTILGFSLYDTIVVFDRVRENIPRMPNAAFSQIYNRSMSEVIVRSLATSFCAALPILALLLFGGETLKDFAFALLVGTLSGTYSSVFIAGPVLTHWKEREPSTRPASAHPRAVRRGAAPTRSRWPGAPGRRGPEGEQAPPRPRDAAERSVAGRLEDRVRRDGARPRHRGRGEAAGGAPSGRPAGGRRARSRGNGNPTTPPTPAAEDPQQDSGDGSGDKPKKPRNRRHGRPR